MYMCESYPACSAPGFCLPWTTRFVVRCFLSHSSASSCSAGKAGRDGCLMWATEHFTRSLTSVCAAADELRRDRMKKTKNDATVRLASLVHKEGRGGVEAEWERSSEFHEAWKLKVCHRALLSMRAWMSCVGGRMVSL